MIQFLIGLNECHSNMRSQALCMKPFPSLSQVFNIALNSEKQLINSGTLAHGESCCINFVRNDMKFGGNFVSVGSKVSQNFQQRSSVKHDGGQVYNAKKLINNTKW